MILTGTRSLISKLKIGLIELARRNQWWSTALLLREQLKNVSPVYSPYQGRFDSATGILQRAQGKLRLESLVIKKGNFKELINNNTANKILSMDDMSEIIQMDQVDSVTSIREIDILTL